MTDKEILEAKEKVISAGLELVRTGLIARTWGNISARISDTQFVITPSGRGYESLTPEDIVTVNIEDLSYEGSIKPSSEKGVHAAAYRNRRDVNFVVHTHQYYATVLSTLSESIPVSYFDKSASRVLGEEIPTAGYGLSGTKTLIENVEKAILSYPDSKAVLMRSHGVLCMGKDYEDAFVIAHSLEGVAKKEYIGIVGGKAPEDMDPNYRLENHMQIFHRNVRAEQNAYAEIFRSCKNINCITRTDAPHIKQYSAYGKPLAPYIDDIAMFVGGHMECLPADAPAEEMVRAVTEENSIVLLKGTGAICTGSTEEDAKALVMILDKGCMAALLGCFGRHPAPLDPEDVDKEHSFYVQSYSKLK